MNDLLRPRRHLIAISRRYPDAWRLVDEMRADRGKRLPDWPDWCFLPLAGAYAIVSRGQAPLPLDQVGDVARLAALAAWRPTQGIYRFHPTLFDEVWETPVEGDLPVDVLHRLPEWCVYVETPGRRFGADPIHGFFAHLEHDANDGRMELRLLLDMGETLDDLMPLALHLVGTIPEALQSMAAEAERQAHLAGMDVPPEALDAPAKMVPYVEPLVSLVLFLCSAAAEHRTADGRQMPVKPRPIKTKRGPRLFAPDEPTIWETGFRIGEALYRAHSASSSGHRTAGETGRTVRPHLRRAHWHTYWVGPRSDPEKRHPELRWLPPIPVNMRSIDELKPTIRHVRVLKPREGWAQKPS